MHLIGFLLRACDKAGMKIITKKNMMLSLSRIPNAVCATSERQYTAVGPEIQAPWDGIYE